MCRIIQHLSFPYFYQLFPVADPGFPIGGAPTLWGAPTSNVYTFWQKHMRKRKKLILLGGGHVLAAPPWIRQWFLLKSPAWITDIKLTQVYNIENSIQKIVNGQEDFVEPHTTKDFCTLSMTLQVDLCSITQV